MRKVLIPALIVVPFIGFMVFQAKTVDPVLTEAPKTVLGEVVGYVREAMKMSEAESTVLPSDTRVEKFLYLGEGGEQFLVTAVIGGRGRSSIHRPELCLPANGFEMRSPRDFWVVDRSWHCLDLCQRNYSPHVFAYSFFNQAGVKTSSHLYRIFMDVWDRTILGRIDRWVMVTVYSSSADERTMLSFLRKLKLGGK